MSWTVYTVANSPYAQRPDTFVVRAVKWTDEGPEDLNKAPIVASHMTEADAVAFADRSQRDYDHIRATIVAR